MKHPYIIFVGDRPSTKNKSRVVPFIGTQSYQTLLQWMYVLDVDFRWCDIVHADNDFLGHEDRVTELNKNIQDGTVLVVALGRTAEKYLRSQGVVGYKILPNPSPKNRVLSAKSKVNRILKTLKLAVHGANPEN